MCSAKDLGYGKRLAVVSFGLRAVILLFATASKGAVDPIRCATCAPSFVASYMVYSSGVNM